MDAPTESLGSPAIAMDPSQGLTDVEPPQDPLDIDVQDPPPPYPAPERHARTHHTGRRRRTVITPHRSVPSSHQGHAADPSVPAPQGHHLAMSDQPVETTPLLAPAGPTRRHFLRPRSISHTSTIRSSSSCAPSLAQTVLSLFQDSDVDSEAGAPQAHGQRCYYHRPTHDGVPNNAHGGLHSESTRWHLLTVHGWARYFRPLRRRAYHAAAFHLLVLNFPYALVAWIYLFVFTLTGTTLLITLPIGAVLCFLDLLGARAFSRGELALQTRFHGPLAHPPPSPPQPIFQRPRSPQSTEIEDGIEGAVYYETSFYRNAYAMFTDPTTYQALFYFLVIKPGITIGMTVLLVVLVPASYVLVLPAPLVLRLVRRLGIWQANVAVEGLYYTVS